MNLVFTPHLGREVFVPDICRARDPFTLRNVFHHYQSHEFERSARSFPKTHLTTNTPQEVRYVVKPFHFRALTIASTGNTRKIRNIVPTMISIASGNWF